MATFAYEALTRTGRLMRGILEAGSVEEAMQLLGQMHLEVNSIEQAPAPAPQGRISRAQFLLFNQQLASITKAGIPIERGLRDLAHEVASSRMRRLIEEVASDLESGLSLDQALDKHRRLFGPLYSRILRAGVQTGRLPEMLTTLCRHMEFTGQTRRVLVEALTYPGLVLVFALVILKMLFLVVVPQFETVLQEMAGRRLNPLTASVLEFSQYIVGFSIGVGLVVAAAGGAWVLAGRSGAGRRCRERLAMRVPLIGGIWYAGTISRFAEAAATLVAAGCDMPACLRLAADASGSEELVAEAGHVAGQLEQGRPILEAGQFARVIPRFFLYSVQLGVQRNQVQDNLHNLADMYAGQARFYQSRVSASLLPMLVLAVGGLVGLVVLSLFLPMVQVVSGLSGS